MKKIIKECPILCGIVAIAVILSVVSLVFMGTTYGRYSDPVKEGKAPLLSMFFRGITDGVYPWSGVQDGVPGMLAEDDGEQALQEAQETVDDNEQTEVASVETQEASADETAAVKEDETSEVTADDVESDDQTQDETAETGSEDAAEEAEEEVPEEVIEEEPKIYEFTDVDDEYFNDALFIGDSRTVGLSEYCEALDTRATFYSKISLTIYDALSKKFIRTGKGRISIEEALHEEQYGKIYIMLGLNEIGTGDSEYFKNAYEEVINRIRELQPDAIIFIQGIMHVTANKSNNDKYFNNTRINSRNAVLSELADQSTVFYIDLNEAVDDENGNLTKELSFDDIHLKAATYEIWHEFLLHKGIVR